MIRAIYKALCRAPDFRGRHRLDNAFRKCLLTAPDNIAEGLRMQLDIQEWTQLHLFSGDGLEPKTVRLLKTILRPGDTFIDVGCHVGFHSLVASRQVGPWGRVFAIDPQPYNCDRILTNSQLNSATNILVLQAAAGASDGFIQLHNQKANDKSRLTLSGPGVGDATGLFEVPLVRLDTVMARHSISAVRLMKVDVEGYEQEVFAGAWEALRVTEHVIFEVLPETDIRLARNVQRTMLDHGFILRQVDGSDWAPGEPAIECNVWASREL